MAKRTVIEKRAPSHDHSRVLTTDGQINVSQSKVTTWRTCKRKFYNRYVLGLTRKKVKRPFMFGTIVHKVIETHLEGGDWNEVLDKIELDNKKLFRREIEMYGNIIEDIRDIMKDYFIHWGDELKPLKHDGRRSEFEFRVELESGLWFTGKIDTMGKAKGLRWVVEHKTFTRMPSEDDRWRSVQGGVYLRATDIMGIKPMDGIMWDYVSSKPPMVPETLLKNGKFSQARLNTVPTRLLRWIKEEGYSKADYTKILADAKANRSNYFVRVYSPLKKPIVDMIWEEFIETAREIAEQHGTKKAQNIGRHCSWCDYRDLCKTEAVGADVEWLIEREFEVEDLSHKTTEKIDRTED